ncbi:MAG: response regulator transcription factor [Bacteroidota bacterium]
MKRILVVEDDQSILLGLVENLRREHYTVDSVSDGALAVKTVKKKQFDVIILDVMLPSMDGFEVCRKLREDGIQVPILMLTGKGEETDKVVGLELGADDYVTKPFSIRELLARVKVLLRRSGLPKATGAEIVLEDIHIDFSKQEATRGNRSIKMSAREFALLAFFVRNEGEVVERDRILNEVWGYDVTPTTRTVDNYVLSLRKKLEKDPAKPKHFLTIHTTGYKFVR